MNTQQGAGLWISGHWQTSANFRLDSVSSSAWSIRLCRCVATRDRCNPAGLTVVARTRFTWMLVELFGNLKFLFLQAEQGTISESRWTRWQETLKWWLRFPGVLDRWRGKPTPFTPEFSHCVEQCIAEGYQPESPGSWEKFLFSSSDPATG